MNKNKEPQINVLRVEVKTHTLTWDETGQAKQDYVEYYIDGKSLREILTIENGNLNFVERNIGVEPSDFFFPEKNFLGEEMTALIEEDGSRIIFLCSDCGHLLCDDIAFDLEEKDNYVIWKNFKKPRYSGEPIPFKGGPFIFDRKQYEEVLRGEQK